MTRKTTARPGRPDCTRVVHVITRLNVGGVSAHVVALAAAPPARYPNLVVAGSVRGDEADMSDEAVRRGVDLVRMPELGRSIRPWADLIAFLKLYRLLRRTRPAIVCTHTAKAGTLGRLAALLAGVPVRIHTFHGHVFQGYFSPRMSRLVVAAERLLARTSTCIVAITAGQAEDLVARYRVCSREHLRVIPYGFDLDRFAPAPGSPRRREFREQLQVPEGVPVVTIAGRLTAIKNHDLFLRAAAAVLERGVPAVFAIVGGGEDEPRLRRLATELGIAEHVRFAGWRSDVERVYAGSDIVALTSLNEGAPVALIEALAAGAPIVATAVGGVPDVLEHGRAGVLVPPGEPRPLADALVALLADPGRRRLLGEAARASALRRFDVRTLLHTMDDLYDELLAAVGPRPSHQAKARAV